jgi:CheY-like chemotaxis protein
VADADRVQQVAWNILSNAVKFTPPGGTVDVSITTVDKSVRLIVKDSGEGISGDFLPYVFERFRQANASTSRTEGGLGLGLALVRQLVELHGGRIFVESEGRGKGSTFTVSFPEPTDEIASSPQLSLAMTPGSLQSIRVLVVDDDADWRELLTMALTEHGADVTAVSSTREALAVLGNAALERPKVVIVDIGLPGDDGYVLLAGLQQMRDTIGDIPAIAVTAYAGNDNERKALAAGFQRHYAKPVAADTVAMAVLDVVPPLSSRTS